jgi:hypothetical protein
VPEQVVLVDRAEQRVGGVVVGGGRVAEAAPLLQVESESVVAPLDAVGLGVRRVGAGALEYVLQLQRVVVPCACTLSSTSHMYVVASWRDISLMLLGFEPSVGSGGGTKIVSSSCEITPRNDGECERSHAIYTARTVWAP